MDTPRRRARVIGIFALVFALHATIGWLFLTTTRLLSKPRYVSQSLQIVFIQPEALRRESESAGSRLEPPRVRGAPAATAPARTAPPTPSAPLDESAFHAPIDWNDELSRAAVHAVPADPAPTPKDFGFPHAAAPPPSKTEEFGWDYAHTHRVESIDGGGLLIHLNDNCVLVLFPLPFAGCAMGKRKANGDLFKHMHEPSAPTEAGNTP